MNQSQEVSERPLRLAAVILVATLTPVASLPAESLKSETAGRLATPPATSMNLFIGTHLVRPTTARS